MNKKRKHQKLFAWTTGFVLSATTLGIATKLIEQNTNNNILESQVNLSIVDDRSPNKETLVADIHSPTIVTKNGYIISSFYDKVQIKNYNNENIYILDNVLIKKILNSQADLKVLKTKEQNDKLVVIVGEKDSNNRQLSSYLIVFDLITKNISYAQQVNGFANPVDLVYFLSDDKLLLTNGRNSIANIKNKNDAVVFDLTSMSFDYQNFSNSNLLNEIDSTKYNPNYSYLIDINQNDFNNKKYMYVLGSKDQKTYEILMYEINDLMNLSVKNQDPVVVSKNNLGYPGNAYLNGTKFYNTEIMNFNFSYMSAEKLIISFSSSMRHQLAFSTVDLTSNTLINSFNFGTEKFVKKISSARNYDSFGYRGSTDRLSDYLIYDFQRTDRLGHLKPIVKDESTLYVPIVPYNRLGYYPRTGGKTSQSDDIYFKGRFAIFKFSENLNEITKVDGFRNQKDQLASWIAKDQNNVSNTTSLEQNEYLYGFINKIDNKIFASNGKSDLIYTMNENVVNNNVQVEYNKNIASQNIVDDLNVPSNIDLTTLASQYVNENQEEIKNWFKQKDLINNVNITSNDLLGEVYINYEINTNTWYSSQPTTIKRTKIINGFKNLIDFRPNFKLNDDPSLYDVSNQDAFKAKAISDITKDDIIKYNIINIPNHEINKDYIRIENKYNIELKVYYEDPQLEPYKSFFQLFNNYNGFSKINQDEANNISYSWNFDNELLLKEKKYLPSEFDQEITKQLFSLVNATNDFEVSAIANDETKTLELTAKVYLNPLFFTTIQTKIEGFGDKNKPPKDLVITTISIVNNEITKDVNTKTYTLGLNFENIITPKYVSFDIVDPKTNIIIKSFIKQNINNQALTVDISDFEDDKEYIINNFRFYEEESANSETNKVEIKEETPQTFNFRTILPHELQKQISNFNLKDIKNTSDHEQKSISFNLMNIDLNDAQSINLVLDFIDDQKNVIQKNVEATKQKDGSFAFDLVLPNYNETYFLNSISYQNQPIFIDENTKNKPLIIKKDEAKIQEITYENISKNNVDIIIKLNDIYFKNELNKSLILVLKSNNQLKEFDVTSSLDLNSKTIKYTFKDLEPQTQYEVIDLKINDKPTSIIEQINKKETNFKTNNKEVILKENNSENLNQSNDEKLNNNKNIKPNEKSKSVIHGIIGGISSVVTIAIALIIGFVIKKKMKK